MVFFFSSRRRHTRFDCDWSSDVCSSDLRKWLAVAARLERTERPEEERLSEPFRTQRPSADFSVLGRTRWDMASVRLSRSEERRVGKEWRSRWSAELAQEKKSLRQEVGDT